MMIFNRTEPSRTKAIDDRGQASLEMVLLLVISMFIALGTIYRFNTAFKTYTTDMFGTYYRCLLETGELPGVASVCADRKARFDIANGRELVRNVPGSGGTGGSGASPGNSGGGSAGSGQSGEGQSSAAAAAPARNSGGSGGSESVGGSSQSSGGGTGSVIGRLRDLGRQRSTAVGQVGDEKKSDGSSGSDTSSVSFYGSRATTNELRRPQTQVGVSSDSGSTGREEKSKVSPSAIAKAAAKTADRGDSLRPRVTAENTDRKPAANLEEDKGGGLEFGKLFRIFIIIVLIVAIAVFLGGQVLQISKSREQ